MNSDTCAGSPVELDWEEVREERKGRRRCCEADSADERRDGREVCGGLLGEDGARIQIRFLVSKSAIVF